MSRRKCFEGTFSRGPFCKSESLPGADFCAEHLFGGDRDCAVACCVPLPGGVKDNLCAKHREELSAWREIHPRLSRERWLASRENTQLARLADLEERGM